LKHKECSINILFYEFMSFIILTIFIQKHHVPWFFLLLILNFCEFFLKFFVSAMHITFSLLYLLFYIKKIRILVITFTFHNLPSNLKNIHLRIDFFILLCCINTECHIYITNDASSIISWTWTTLYRNLWINPGTTYSFGYKTNLF
jgi:hypothetical protein